MSCVHFDLLVNSPDMEICKWYQFFFILLEYNIVHLLKDLLLIV